jgi:ATP-dependent DNA helicase RecG
MNLASPLADVVGGKAAKALDKAFGLTTVGDLLRHYPRRYAERGQLTDLAQLQVGDQVTVLAEVKKAHRRQMRNRRGSLFEVVVGDGTRTLALTFFNQPWRERELTVGTTALFAGKVTDFRGTRQLNSPDYQLLGDTGDVDALADFVGALIPVYPASAGLPSWTIARCVRLALDTLDPLADPLPAALRARYRLVSLNDALRGIHRPADWPEKETARTRLKWDEAMVVQTVMAQRRQAAAARPALPRPATAGGLLDAFEQRLPFALTDGQVEVGETIAAELARPHPMHRLLQGEVGSGKTVCALRGMLQVVDAGGQAALLAPTSTPGRCGRCSARSARPVSSVRRTPRPG